MDLGYVKKLVKLLSDSEIHEIEIEEEGKKIRIAKGNAPQLSHAPVIAPPHVVVAPAHPEISAVPPAGAESSLQTAPAAQQEKKVHEIKSPIVGTFYRAPSPDAAPFVQAGSMIQPGTVLCIVEAMKLMNEIESDVAGRVVKVMVQNGQPVEYGQTLFEVEAV